MESTLIGAEQTIATGVFVERKDVTEAELEKAGVDLVRDFPGSSTADFKRYPVLSEGGWLDGSFPINRSCSATEVTAGPRGIGLVASP
jgi:hypothetical protein